MLGAVLRVPAPIPPLLPAPPRPLLALRRCRSHCLPPGTPMASAAPRDAGAGAGATKPDAAPEPAPVPEPPEKPLPGDCCGSGCVRCVWDIYYDELEAYNKALAAHSLSTSPGSGGSGKAPADSKPSNDAKS